uniref:PHD-type domain-containing protein n=1 Tax=Glycine max TaxID=3847 RepID=A0A0R0JLI4_SOYBN
MLCFLCTLLLPVMTGGRCHPWEGMAEGGDAAAVERRCEVNFPAEIPRDSAVCKIDYLSQARKSLAERSPFDVAEETSTSAAAVTLPSGLAVLLNRQGDNRRRPKKSHSGANKRKSSNRANQKKPDDSNIWIETEQYFRDLTVADIDTLFEASRISSLMSQNCFTIPCLGNAPRYNAVTSNRGNGMEPVPRFNEVVCSEDGKKGEDENKGGEVVENEDELLVIEAIDDVTVEQVPPQDDKSEDISDSSVSLEWFLGCRNKVSLTSERPTKKRRLLGVEAGLEKVSMTCPCDEGQLFCHYCGRGDTSRDSNRLIVCASCKVVVHRKCYGVYDDDVDGTWMCSWCKQKVDVDESSNPCVLCPKKGGALKPVNSSAEGAGLVPFVHLFCSLWMPEVYIDDLKKMEPVMNVGEIKETRKKLMCSVCKAKCGACVRCSHGSCRASFHPLCAREARHRMEVWAKYGNNNVELRAFCLKHSDLPENRSILPLKGSIADGGLSDCRLSAHDDMLGCGAVPQQDVGVVGRANENVDASDSLSFALVLKKLIDRGKVDVKDVALEIGISPDTLTANTNEAYMAPDVQHKIVNWLKAHVYTNAFQKGLKVKFKPANASKNDSEAIDGSDTLPISDSGLLDPVAVKSVPPRRRTTSNIRILKDNKVICSSEGVIGENGMPVDMCRVGQSDCDNPTNYNEASIPNATEMNLTKSEDIFHEVQGNASGCVSAGNSTACLLNASVLSDHCLVHSASEPLDFGFIKKDAISSYIHPYINKKLLQIRDGVPLEDIICSSDEGNSSLVESFRASACSSSQNQNLTCIDISKPDEVNMEQLVRARKMGLLEFSPQDELEGELVYFQHRLLQNAVAKKRHIDNLIYSVAKSLPHEIDKAHQQRWDDVIVNQYLRDLREAKKQGRKERKHKEAQAVLAAATAAAAASTRALRKDTLDESMQQENLLKLDTLNGRTGACSQPMSRAKETLSRVAVTRTSSEKYSDFCMPTSDLSKEHCKSCDICRRSEFILNPILVCSGCKVSVHLDCYRSVKETTGPWYCELCEDLSSRSSGASAINFWEKPVAECALCGGTTGAFRKSSNGQWVHAFCAEWVFESTFKRGQINAVEGMETLPKGVDICCICHHKHGVCMKCCYGHCQTTFHPSCARSAGLYMNVRTTGGKAQHKAYCEKHSLEQKAKAETQKHGIEELKSIRQIRVELERLRLLCERIVKREKIKSDIQNLHVAFSVRGNWYYVHMTYWPLKEIMLLGPCWFEALSSFRMVVQNQLQRPLKGTQRDTDHAVNHFKDQMMLLWTVQFLLSAVSESPYLWTQTQNWTMTAQPLKVDTTTGFQIDCNFLARRFLIELLHHVIFQMKVDGYPNLEIIPIDSEKSLL